MVNFLIQHNLLMAGTAILANGSGSDAGSFAIIFCIIAVAVFGSCSVITRKKNEE